MSCNLFLISNVLLNSIFEQKVYQSDEKVKPTEMLKDIIREMGGESGRKVVSVQILPRWTFLPGLPTLATGRGAPGGQRNGEKVLKNLGIEAEIHGRNRREVYFLGYPTVWERVIL